MELLNQEGNIVDDAAQIIDSTFNYPELPSPQLTINNFPCTPNATQKKIFEAIHEIQVSDNADLVAISNYTPKIYGILSRKISNLDPEFIPFAECIVAFIDQWCINGGAKDNRKYGYEICSTVRSWYVQQNIITGTQYKDNGLSWSLYKKALSVNVYYLEEDQLSETSGSTTFVKKTINFQDNSAKKFIEDAQKWFSLHKTNTGKNIKIYGVYPDIETAIRKGKYKLHDEYLQTNDTVFWAGLFSAYSNFTSWEYHPGLMPNEVWKLRQSFLNTSFVSDGNQNILDRIEAVESFTYQDAKNMELNDTLSSINSFVGSSLNLFNSSNNPNIVKYLSTNLEIMEEDFLSLYNLKVNINTSSQYTVEKLFKWANNNQSSLAQTITLARLSGDVEGSVLFYNISNELGNDIVYDDNGNPYLLESSSFTIVGSEESEYYLQCIDMFGDVLKFPFNKKYILPCDYMPASGDFDLIDLSYNTSTSDAEADNLLDNAQLVGNEISNMSSELSRPSDGVNEFGPLASIDVDPRKALYNAESIADSIYRSKNYNEMITPPESVNSSNSKAILDITLIGKRLVANITSKSNEMIQPEKA